MIAAEQEFQMAVAAAGLTPPDTIIGDGVLHRFSSNGKARDDSGWYVLHLDGVPSGAFGCWREGMQSTWCAKSETTMTQTEREAHRNRIAVMHTQRDAARTQRHEQARVEVAALLSNAHPAQDHSYLTAKAIQPHGVQCDGARLLIPMRDTTGTLHSVQTIAPDGDKRFHPGGRVTGCYFAIGKPDGSLIVSEGYATGASIHECTGQAVAVAFNAGNLEPVALALRSKYPSMRIIIAADDDHQTDGNPGIVKATAAARAVGGLLALPVFPSGRPDKATDFNDLHHLAGADAVRVCIEAGQTCDEIADAAASTGWPEPTPLPDALPPVDPFDAELLPLALRPWVMDIAHRMQCPPDFPAVAALVGLSSLIGARAVIQPKARDDWQVVPNLWGAVVGRPGVKKSPALNEALKPLYRLQSAGFELHKTAHEAWELDCKVLELAAAGREKKAKGIADKDRASARCVFRSS